MAGTLEIPAVGSPNSTEDPKIKTAVEALNKNLNKENNVGWYKPSIIATEQERESASFGTLTTPDEIKNVELPENGLIALGYDAIFKSTIGGAGRVAIFIGANQLKRSNNGATEPEVTEVPSESTTSTHISSFQGGLTTTAGVWSGSVTTGQVLGATATFGGLCYIFAAAGTYNVSVQFRATSGKVSAKQRKLWVAVMGV